MYRSLKELFWQLVHMTEHNEHFIPVTLFGKEIKTCARCLGMYLGAFIFLPAVLILFFSDFDLFRIMFVSASERFGFWEVFLVSWLLFGFAIVDWSIAKLKIWQGNNNIRFLTGLTLGTGHVLYIFLLPLPIGINIASLASYWFVFSITKYIVYCRQLNLSLRNPIKQNVAIIAASNPLIAGQIGCSQTGGACECCTCCPCGSCTACCCNPFCCCIGVIPIALILKASMNKMEKKQDEQ